jgi:hypothetical protein
MISQTLSKTSRMEKSQTIRKICGCGNIYVTFVGVPIRKDEKTYLKRLEIHGGKWGTCLAVNLRSNASLINEMLSNGKSLEDVIGIINNVHCFRMRKQDERWTYSCVDSISHAIQIFLKSIE